MRVVLLHQIVWTPVYHRNSMPAHLCVQAPLLVEVPVHQSQAAFDLHSIYIRKRDMKPSLVKHIDPFREFSVHLCLCSSSVKPPSLHFALTDTTGHLTGLPIAQLHLLQMLTMMWCASVWLAVEPVHYMCCFSLKHISLRSTVVFPSSCFDLSRLYIHVASVISCQLFNNSVFFCVKIKPLWMSL